MRTPYISHVCVCILDLATAKQGYLFVSFNTSCKVITTLEAPEAAGHQDARGGCGLSAALS